MAVPVDGVSHIVHEAGDLRHLPVMLAVSKFFKDHGRPLRHHGAVGSGMVRKAHGPKIIVSFFQICENLSVLPDVLIRQFFSPLISSFLLSSRHLSNIQDFGPSVNRILVIDL